VNDTEFTNAIHEMEKAGRKAGKSAATWLCDGNTSKEAAQTLLKTIENCELEVPSPFSGEFADEPSLDETLSEVLGIDVEELQEGERDILAEAFEFAFYDGYLEEAERLAVFYAKNI